MARIERKENVPMYRCKPGHVGVGIVTLIAAAMWHAIVDARGKRSASVRTCVRSLAGSQVAQLKELTNVAACT